MPYKWVDSEEFCTFPDANGQPVTVYHLYDNDDIERPYDEHFTTHPNDSDGFSSEYAFDIRDLQTAKGYLSASMSWRETPTEVKEILRQAILTGEVLRYDEDD